MLMNKVVKAGAALLLASTLLTTFPQGNILQAQAAQRDTADFTVMDINFDFNDMLMPIYRMFGGFGLDFLNVDFTKYDMTAAGNANIIQTAAMYLPAEYYEDLVTIRADDLTAFMLEAYNIDLPRETTDIYAYDKKSDTFTYPGADVGFNIDCWKPKEFKVNSDGSITAKADLYIIGFTFNEDDALYDNIKKPVELWDKGITRGKIASSEITFMLNEDFKYFPMRLISIKSEAYDWNKATGTYTTEDGAFSLSFGMDTRYDNPPDYMNQRLNILFTDIKKDKKYILHANIMDNCAAVHTFNYTLDAFISLNSDGTITVSDIVGAYGIDISGKYTKISDDVPPVTAKIDLDMQIITGDEIDDMPGEHYIYGTYSIPTITGFGDDELDQTVSAQIADIITEKAEEYKNDLNSFLAEIEEEEDEETKQALLINAENYVYYSNISLVTSSDFYYAIAEYVDEYRGGAHGMSYLRTYNIDTNKKQILRLEDILNDGAKEALEDMLFEMAQTDEYKDRVYEDLEKIEITDETAFYLSDDSLNIIYPPYEIGPYAMGFISFKLHFSETANILLDEYQNGDFMREMTDQELLRY